MHVEAVLEGNMNMSILFRPIVGLAIWICRILRSMNLQKYAFLEKCTKNNLLIFYRIIILTILYGSEKNIFYKIMHY
jgi:hypothetical protein